MANVEKHFYEFGPFRINTVERVLYRGEEMIPLTPKAIETLLVLIANRARVVDKVELLKLVWPDVIVEEGALAKNVSALRQVLGNEYIATIHRRGYKFAAAVNDVDPKPVPTPDHSVDVPPKPVPNPDPAPWPRWLKRAAWLVPTAFLVLLTVLMYQRSFGPPKPPPITSLAVLPLHNLNDLPQEYFADGMTDELINTLAKIEALRVISRTSAMIYKKSGKPLPQIARDLKVDAIVEGSVLQSGNQVRITAQLFRAKTEQQLWAQSYERDFRDVLALQGDVARDIAREIQIKLTPQEKQRLSQARQVRPEAYLNYAHGRHFWNNRTREGFQKATEYFQRAIAIDPGYAPAYAGLADALSLSGSIGSDVFPPTQVMPKAKTAALEATRLDENLAEAHTSLAYVMLSYDWDLDAAEREFKRAIEINPGYATAHHWYGHYFLARGQPEQALAEMRRAEVADPLSFIISMGVGWGLYHARRYDEAIAKYRATLDMNLDSPLTHSALGMALVQKQRYQEALAEFRKALNLPGSPSFALANIAATYAFSRKSAEARQVLAQLRNSATQQYVPAIYVAAVYAALGDEDRAITWLQKAYYERSDYLVYLKTEPSFDSMRADPRFKHLMQQVGSGK